MLATFLGIYLILGLPVVLVIWMMLKVSKKRDEKVQEKKYERANYNRFHEQKTEPDSVRS